MLGWNTLIGVMCAAMLSCPLPAQASVSHERAKAECRFQWMDPGVWTQHEEDVTAWCVERKWPVLGGLAKLRAVISCESGWWRKAWNGLGPYVGLAQHALSSWAYRVRTYRPRWWNLRRGWSNSRTQLVVTVRMVRAEGWSAWTCA